MGCACAIAVAFYFVNPRLAGWRSGHLRRQAGRDEAGWTRHGRRIVVLIKPATPASRRGRGIIHAPAVGDGRGHRCPLWVISGHLHRKQRCTSLCLLWAKSGHSPSPALALRIARRVPRLRAAFASAAFFQSAFGNAIEHYWRRRRSALARPIAVYLLQPFQKRVDKPIGATERSRVDSPVMIIITDEAKRRVRQLDA